MGIPAEALLPFIFGSSGGGGGGGGSTYIPTFGSLATISTGTSWSGDDPYTSTVTLTGYTVTGNTMVSVLPSTDVVEQMAEDGITNIFITNNNGTLTATAVGAAPTAAMTLQVLCTESDQSATISSLPGIVGNGVLETLQATDLTDAINKLSTAINGKQDKPATAGTAGQVLGLDNNLDPVWVNQSGGGGSSGKLATVSTGTSWSGSDPYTSTVTVTGYTVTGKTMVSILPSNDVIAQMIEDGTTNIFITNNNGTLTASAIGAAPTAAMTLQVLCTEND